MNPSQKLAHLYIDGHNLFNRALRATPYKWLNPVHLAEALAPECRIDAWTYATARVRAMGDDGRPTRQDLYLRALGALNPAPTMLWGRFDFRIRKRPLATDPATLVRVRESVEKSSDVNLGSQMAWDAHAAPYQVCLLIAADLDYLHPVRLLRSIGVEVVLLSPSRGLAAPLRDAVSEVRFIEPFHLSTAQLPMSIPIGGQVLHCPPEWLPPSGISSP